MNLIKRTLLWFWLTFSIVGIFLIVYFSVLLWQQHPHTLGKLSMLANNGTEILESVEEGLEIIDDGIDNISDSLDDLKDSTDLIQESINNTAEMGTSLETMLEEDFTNMASNTVIAIDRTKSSAAVIDGTLYAFSRIPLIGISYNPETSLSHALGEIATELKDMPEILTDLAQTTGDTTKNLTALGNQITGIKTSLDEMQSTLDEASLLVEEYQSQANTAKSNLVDIKEKLPNMITTVFWGITILAMLLINGLVGSAVQAWGFLHIKK